MTDPTDNEYSDKPSLSPQEQTAESGNTHQNKEVNSTNNPDPMEVHHHAHHSGKKTWKSYFWEFLMLFLAVFCGFLAENQREHYVENMREKVYMRSLVEDLDTDIAQMETYIGWKKEVNQDFDTLMQLFSSTDPGANAHRIYVMADRVITRFGLPEISERTIQQLKNSGGLRLIRKENVASEINMHYLNTNRMKSSYDVEKLVRVNLIKSRGDILDASTLYRIRDTTLSSAPIKLVSRDPVVINHFLNDVLAARQFSLRLSAELAAAKASSERLKALIQKEYSFE